ncbi:MAG TPA: VOC family protein [Aggregatilineaceae bacterium]|nr:VOC family protein [Aggregatilineaceae bacterium]
MPRPTHFEINAKDLAKVTAFYRSVFDWKIEKWDGPMDYWLVGTGEDSSRGIDGAIFNSEGLFMGTVNTVEVPNLEAYIARVQANGGQPIGDIQAIPGIGRFTYCKDVEGNLFGLMENEPGAQS